MTGRVAVNLLWCVPGEVGGSEQYLVRQLDGLGITPEELEPTLYCSRAFADAHRSLADRCTTVSPPGDLSRRALRIAVEHTWLASRTRRADVVHHGGGTVPALGGAPIVLTIHDLQYLDLPAYHSRAKLGYLRAVVPASVRRATVVATPTEWVRSGVVERFGVDPNRVVVVRHGFDPPAAVATARDVRTRFRLGGGPLVVFPAITHPHKGHRFLLDTMARHWTDPDLRLVLLGGAGAADDAVEAQIDRLALRGRVVRPGRVGDADRDGLIAAADALVFPSEYEGFGAPVIEAMALGTPVVCSDHPALAEVVGDAALVLPLDDDAWAGALAEVGRRRDELRAAGTERAAIFSVAASGADLRTAYRRALEAGA